MIHNLDNSLRWLLTGEGWIRYNTLIHLLDLDPSHPQALAAYKSMTQDKKIQSLLDDIQECESTVLKRHNDANHPIHKLSFLAEIGYPGDDPKILQSLGLIFQLLKTIKTVYKLTVISLIFNHSKFKYFKCLINSFTTKYDM